MAAVHVVCVLAAGVMVVRSRTARTRVAHLVMLLTMVVVALDGGAVVLAGAAAALAVTGTWLARHRAEIDATSCCLDLLANASLVALMGVASLTTTGGSHHGHGGGMAGGPDPTASILGPDHVVPALAVVVVLTWAAAGLRLRQRGGRPSADVPAWSMMLAMGAMTFR